MSPRRRRPSTLLLESALIVASILLAFALNGWWEARQERRLAARALASFEQEVRQNRENLLAVMPYHRHLHILFSELSVAGAVTTFDDVRYLEGFEGWQPPVLTSTAWSTAIATGALAHLDYDTVREISALYALQDRFVRHSDGTFLTAPGALTDANIGATVVSAEIHLTDLTNGSVDMIAAYDRLLAVLAGRRPGAGAAHE
jgi:hypothetical protein